MKALITHKSKQSPAGAKSAPRWFVTLCALCSRVTCVGGRIIRSFRDTVRSVRWLCDGKCSWSSIEICSCLPEWIKWKWATLVWGSCRSKSVVVPHIHSVKISRLLKHSALLKNVTWLAHVHHRVMNILEFFFFSVRRTWLQPWVEGITILFLLGWPIKFFHDVHSSVS